MLDSAKQERGSSATPNTSKRRPGRPKGSRNRVKEGDDAQTSGVTNGTPVKSKQIDTTSSPQVTGDPRLSSIPGSTSANQPSGKPGDAATDASHGGTQPVAPSTSTKAGPSAKPKNKGKPKSGSAPINLPSSQLSQQMSGANKGPDMPQSADSAEVISVPPITGDKKRKRSRPSKSVAKEGASATTSNNPVGNTSDKATTSANTVTVPLSGMLSQNSSQTGRESPILPPPKRQRKPKESTPSAAAKKKHQQPPPTAPMIGSPASAAVSTSTAQPSMLSPMANTMQQPASMQQSNTINHQSAPMQQSNSMGSMGSMQGSMQQQNPVQQPNVLHQTNTVQPTNMMYHSNPMQKSNSMHRSTPVQQSTTPLQQPNTLHQSNPLQQSSTMPQQSAPLQSTTSQSSMSQSMPQAIMTPTMVAPDSGISSISRPSTSRPSISRPPVQGLEAHYEHFASLHQQLDPQPQQRIDQGTLARASPILNSSLSSSTYYQPQQAHQQHTQQHHHQQQQQQQPSRHMSTPYGQSFPSQQSSNPYNTSTTPQNSIYRSSQQSNAPSFSPRQPTPTNNQFNHFSDNSFIDLPSLDSIGNSSSNVNAYSQQGLGRSNSGSFGAGSHGHLGLQVSNGFDTAMSENEMRERLLRNIGRR